MAVTVQAVFRALNTFSFILVFILREREIISMEGTRKWHALQPTLHTRTASIRRHRRYTLVYYAMLLLLYTKLKVVTFMLPTSSPYRPIEIGFSLKKINLPT